jgi:hypothetical protein
MNGSVHPNFTVSQKIPDTANKIFYRKAQNICGQKFEQILFAVIKCSFLCKTSFFYRRDLLNLNYNPCNEILMEVMCAR